MSIEYMLRLSGGDFGFAKKVKVGYRVQHYGTKMWGVVTKVIPQPDGTAELLVMCDDGEHGWATYHVGAYKEGDGGGA